MKVILTLATIHVFGANANIEFSTECDNVYVVGFFEHRFDFFVSELDDTGASLDKVLIKVGAFLQLTRRYEPQVDNDVV